MFLDGLFRLKGPCPQWQTEIGQRPGCPMYAGSDWLIMTIAFSIGFGSLGVLMLLAFCSSSINPPPRRISKENGAVEGPSLAGSNAETTSTVSGPSVTLGTATTGDPMSRIWQPHFSPPNLGLPEHPTSTTGQSSSSTSNVWSSSSQGPPLVPLPTTWQGAAQPSPKKCCFFDAVSKKELDAAAAVAAAASGSDDSQNVTRAFTRLHPTGGNEWMEMQSQCGSQCR